MTVFVTSRRYPQTVFRVRVRVRVRVKVIPPAVKQGRLLLPPMVIALRGAN